MKFLTFVHTRNAAELGAPPQALMDAIDQLGAEAGARMLEGGAMSDAGSVSIRKGHMVTDGPFAEAKEMVVGYALYDLPSAAEIISWTERFVGLHHQHWPEWDGDVIIQQLHNFHNPA